MFDPHYDPMAILEQMQADMNLIKQNLVELARAFNHQMEFQEQLVQDLNNKHSMILTQQKQIKDLNNRLKEIENHGR